MYRSGGSKSCLIPTTSYDGEPDVMASDSLIPAFQLAPVHSTHPKSERGDPEGQELADSPPPLEDVFEARQQQNIGEIVQMMTNMLDGIDRDLESLEDDFVSGKLDASKISVQWSVTVSHPWN